ncbi:MAG: hypothetical protein NC419_06250 [Muribaculaceae bacterium]|nr:hypothetical protein [Muribaculaceae bacterium]
MDIQQIQKTFNNIAYYANQINGYSMSICFSDIREIKKTLTQISQGIVDEEPYLSSQIMEMRDRLFIGNGLIQPVIAGRVVEILKILMQKDDASNHITSMEISHKEGLDAIQNLNIIFSSFHKVVRQLGIRHDGRSSFEIKDEYDVQDLLHALLRLYFDDVRPEEWTPSYAGKTARMDFLLKSEKIVIEVKKTREGLDDKELGEQLILDIDKYKTHPDCEKLICFVYDPEERIHNPVGIMNDLNKQHDGFAMVIIKPDV